MEMQTIVLVSTLFLILCAELINGWTDAPNAIATVVATRALTLSKAIAAAATLNAIGALLGTAVATTIGRDLVSAESMTLISIQSAMIAVILWGIFAWHLGLPISKSHALIAALSGAAYALGGLEALKWEGWSKVLLGLLLFSVLGGVLGWLFTHIIRFFFHNAPANRSKKTFLRLQVFSACLVALSHGANDGQKFMGILALTLVLGGVVDQFVIQDWVIFTCAAVMALGTACGGRRIMQTMGFRIAHLHSEGGFAAECASSTSIFIASWLGIPLSTTNTIGMAIAGVGYATRPSSVRWQTIQHMVSAWLLTFPVCGLLAYFLAWVSQVGGLLWVWGIAVSMLGALFWKRRQATRLQGLKQSRSSD